jgi:hypothetical protein
MANHVNDDELEFVRSNLQNATSTDLDAYFHSHLIRILANDPTVNQLIIDTNITLALEFLTTAYDTYYDYIDETEDITVEDTDENENEIVKINFYRQINAMGENNNGGLLVHDDENVRSFLGMQISSCPNLEEIIINGEGDWMRDEDLHRLFEDLQPPSTTTLVLRYCSFNTTNESVLIPILDLPQVTRLILDHCVFEQGGAETLVENNGTLAPYESIQMFDCRFHRRNIQDGEDIDLANFIAGSEGIQEVVCAQCNLSPTAVTILNNIHVNGERIARIEN